MLRGKAENLKGGNGENAEAESQKAEADLAGPCSHSAEPTANGRGCIGESRAERLPRFPCHPLPKNLFLDGGGNGTIRNGERRIVCHGDHGALGIRALTPVKKYGSGGGGLPVVDLPGETIMVPESTTATGAGFHFRRVVSVSLQILFQGYRLPYRNPRKLLGSALSVGSATAKDNRYLPGHRDPLSARMQVLSQIPPTGGANISPLPIDDGPLRTYAQGKASISRPPDWPANRTGGFLGRGRGKRRDLMTIRRHRVSSCSGALPSANQA